MEDLNLDELPEIKDEAPADGDIDLDSLPEIDESSPSVSRPASAASRSS